VAAELGDPSGVGGLCGYSVRLDSKVSDATRLVFVTTGVLLRRLMSDPELTGECETPCAIRARELLAERLPDLYTALQLGCGMQKGAGSCICIAIALGAMDPLIRTLILVWPGVMSGPELQAAPPPPPGRQAVLVPVRFVRLNIV
jgi:hypothetical protein